MKVVGFLPCVMHYHRLASAAISECLAGRTFDASVSPAFTRLPRKPSSLIGRCALSERKRAVKPLYPTSYIQRKELIASGATRHRSSPVALHLRPPPSILIQPRMSCSEGYTEWLHASAAGANTCICYPEIYKSLPFCS